MFLYLSTCLLGPCDFRGVWTISNLSMCLICWLPSVSVAYCWVTNYPKTKWLKTTLIILQFCGSEICMQLSWVHCFRIFQRLQSKCWVWLKLCLGSTRERSTFKCLFVGSSRAGSSQHCNLQSEQVRRTRKREYEQDIPGFYNIISKWRPITLAIFYF